MNKDLLSILMALGMCAPSLWSCTEPQEPRPSFGHYQDLAFDQKEVDCFITPDTDTLRFGFHRIGADTLTDTREYMPSMFYIDRWSTAKCDRDFRVPDSVRWNRGFSVFCDKTLYTGEFYIIVYPDKITERRYLKLKYMPAYVENTDSMIIHLIPQL